MDMAAADLLEAAETGHISRVRELLHEQGLGRAERKVPPGTGASLYFAPQGFEERARAASRESAR